MRWSDDSSQDSASDGTSSPFSSNSAVCYRSRRRYCCPPSRWISPGSSDVASELCAIVISPPTLPAGTSHCPPPHCPPRSYSGRSWPRCSPRARLSPHRPDGTRWSRHHSCRRRRRRRATAPAGGEEGAAAVAEPPATPARASICRRVSFPAASRGAAHAGSGSSLPCCVLPHDDPFVETEAERNHWHVAHTAEATPPRPGIAGMAAHYRKATRLSRTREGGPCALERKMRYARRTVAGHDRPGRAVTRWDWETTGVRQQAENEAFNLVRRLRWRACRVLHRVPCGPVDRYRPRQIGAADHLRCGDARRRRGRPRYGARYADTDTRSPRNTVTDRDSAAAAVALVSTATAANPNIDYRVRSRPATPAPSSGTASRSSISPMTPGSPCRRRAPPAA